MPNVRTGLNILVVDDTRTDLAVMTAMLSKMGHEVVQAQSGETALDKFRQFMPDMVLIDVFMPGMGGYDAVREMRRIAQDKWIPIIFVTAMGREDDVVHGIEAGGDDYLLKPIHYKILHAKINALRQHLYLIRRIEEQSRLLLDYQARNEAEQHAARDFMDRLLALDKISDPLVHFHLQPARIFSGDLIAAARSPAGHLYALLADSAGHGLTAALAVIPVLQTFHAMVAKGYSIGSLAAEINRKIGEYMPSNRFVAAALAVVDMENGRVSVWNGGCPPVVLFNPDGTVVCQFDSVHLPLGVLDPDEFDEEAAHYHYGNCPCQMLLCSDGVLEYLGASSLRAGLSRLLEVAKREEPEQRLLSMVGALEGQLTGEQAHDDIALVLVDCPSAGAEEQASAARHIPLQPVVRTPSQDRRGQDRRGQEERLEWQFDLVLSAQQLRQTDIVPLLLHVVGQVEQEGVQISSGKLFMVLSELFNNALDHGVLGLDSVLKNGPNGMDRYFEERATRLNRLEKGEIKIKLVKVSSVHGPCLKIAITDSGEGFDFLALQAAPDSPLLHYGRGLALVESLSGRLHYMDGGRKAYVCIPMRSLEQCAVPLSMGGCNPGNAAAVEATAEVKHDPVD